MAKCIIYSNFIMSLYYNTWNDQFVDKSTIKALVLKVKLHFCLFVQEIDKLILICLIKEQIGHSY